MRLVNIFHRYIDKNYKMFDICALFQENGLYYDGNNGCYYSYNQTENKFEFHSQVYSSQETDAAKTTEEVRQFLPWFLQ